MLGIHYIHRSTQRATKHGGRHCKGPIVEHPADCRTTMIRIKGKPEGPDPIDHIPFPKAKTRTRIQPAHRIIRETSDHYNLVPPFGQSSSQLMRLGDRLRRIILRQNKNSHRISNPCRGKDPHILRNSPEDYASLPRPRTRASPSRSGPKSTGGRVVVQEQHSVPATQDSQPRRARPLLSPPGPHGRNRHRSPPRSLA